MKYIATKYRLNKEGLICSHREIKYGINRVRVHQFRRESFSHFMLKAAISKVVMEKNDVIITEHELPNGGSVDILQIKPKSIIFYEIESGEKRHERDYRNVDEITIKISTLPTEVKKSLETLEKWAKSVTI